METCFLESVVTSAPVY